jgi:hypothetical protein
MKEGKRDKAKDLIKKAKEIPEKIEKIEGEEKTSLKKKLKRC